MMACDIKPTTYEEVLCHECWRLAMLDEMTSIKASGTWKLADLPPGVEAIGLLTVKIRRPSHEFTFGVGISFIPYPLVLTPVV
jgi:hypothetical protein